MSSLTGGARPSTSGAPMAAAAGSSGGAAGQPQGGSGIGNSLSYGSLKNRFLSGVAPKADSAPAPAPQPQAQQAKGASKLFSLSR